MKVKLLEFVVLLHLNVWQRGGCKAFLSRLGGFLLADVQHHVGIILKLAHESIDLGTLSSGNQLKSLGLLACSLQLGIALGKSRLELLELRSGCLQRGSVDFDTHQLGDSCSSLDMNWSFLLLLNRCLFGIL